MNKLVFAMALTFLFSLGLSTGYGDPKDQPAGATSQEVKKEAQEAEGAKTASLKAEAEKYQKEAREELNELKQEVKKLHARVKELNGEAKAKAKEEFRVFQQQAKGAEEKLKSVKTDSAESWEKVKSEIHSAMDSLKETYKKIASHFA